MDPNIIFDGYNNRLARLMNEPMSSTEQMAIIDEMIGFIRLGLKEDISADDKAAIEQELRSRLVKRFVSLH